MCSTYTPTSSHGFSHGFTSGQRAAVVAQEAPERRSAALAVTPAASTATGRLPVNHCRRKNGKALTTAAGSSATINTTT